MRWRPLALAMILIPAATRAQEAMPVEVVAKVKEATTFIRPVLGEDGAAVSGSGFVIGLDGNTGYIVTNAHVMTGAGRDGPAGGRRTAEIVFRSGTKAESRAMGEVVALEPGPDLALLKVTGVPNLPAPVAIDAAAAPFETMTVYIFGFPFGEQLAMGEGNPPVNVGRGQISSLRRDRADRLTSVLLDGALNPGNSGGPVVDARGRLVGVAKSTIRGANIGFAIAVPELAAVLEGRADEPVLTLRSAGEGSAVLEVEFPLIDPLGRLRSARWLHARGTTTPPRGEVPAARDVPSPLPDADETPLTVGRGRAIGSIRVPLEGRDVVISSRFALVDGSGRTLEVRPGRCLLGVARGLTFWGDVVDPDGDCGLRLERGELVGDVPGTLHDLNVDIGKLNAPRVVQGVDGDFVATVKVAGTFQPGPLRTGPKSVPFNGGGLLAWSDDGNYIRLERGAMYRNGRVLGLVNFESREHGTRVAVHNKGGLDPREDRWLRLERHGRRFAGSISPDGRDWEALEPIEVDWPSRLRVGVGAVNSSGDAMSVRFGEFVLVKDVVAPFRGIR